MSVSHLAVIDDELDADLGDGSFFRTYQLAGGLTARLADQLIEYLNKW